MALERATFSPDQFPLLAYRQTIPGLFAQDDLDVTRWLSVSASTRVDRHSTFGWFVSPRIASLVRRGHWSGRASYGSGFFAPTPIVDETEANGFSRFFVGEPLVAERGGTALFDVTRTWPELTVTATVFRSRIQHPVTVERTSVLLMRNLATPLTTNGVEMLAAWRRPPFAATVTYAYTRAREEDDDYLQDLPLTPRHSAGADWLWNRDEWGRVGFECYYTGRQRLERDPFRRFSRPYVAFGALVERKFGPVRVFVNGENLGDVRQTRWSPLVLPTAAPDGRWTVDQWAPLDGRTINGGVRIAF
jgi:iron complex outermembrane receptor protein